jgi:hypothetical protein
LSTFYIRKSYKDKYKTIAATKTINARGGKHIFIALPKDESVEFYINGKLTTLLKYDTVIGYTDIRETQIPYLIYYTQDVFNSNSVIVEMRKV